jgi:hypothetical protein
MINQPHLNMRHNLTPHPLQHWVARRKYLIHEDTKTDTASLTAKLLDVQIRTRQPSKLTILHPIIFLPDFLLSHRHTHTTC